MSKVNPIGYPDVDVRELTIPPLEVSLDAATDLSKYEARAMAVAKGQMGSIFQIGLMMYMFVGNQLSLFNMVFLSNFGMTPIRNILNADQAFSQFHAVGVNTLLPKLAYIALNLVGAGIVLWKIKAMGLLPITSADWISLLPQHSAIETSTFGMPL